MYGSVRSSLFVATITACLLAVSVNGCHKAKPTVIKYKYSDLPDKTIPDVLKDSIFARTDLQNIEGQPITGYGLVVNLNGSGQGPYPTAVREFMIKEMVKR